MRLFCGGCAKAHLKKNMRNIFFLAMLAFLILFVVFSPDRKTQETDIPSLPAPKIYTTFLDIGQGDASLITFDTGEQMLVDCGEDATVLEALGRHMGREDRLIDYLVVTHPDTDHYGGCIDVLRRFSVSTIVTNGLRKSEDSLWREFDRVAEEKGSVQKVIQAQESWSIGSSTVFFLYPDHSIAKNPRIPLGTTVAEDNNTSIVMKLVFGASDVLFTGDAEAPLESYLMSKDIDGLDVDVLKVGHHGSKNSSQTDFLTRVSPEHAVISVGKKNKYGHPAPRVLKRLERSGATMWRTDLSGDILFIMTTTSIEVRTSD